MTPRPLTKGEIALASSVFGNSVDYSRVRVSGGRYIPFQPKGVAMAPNGKLYMHGCYSADYSLENTLAQSLFIHEMTHVWQFQNKILHPVAAAVKLAVRHKFNYAAAYAYALSPGRDLTDYNMEQQASIVQDYFILRQSGFGGKLFPYETVLKKFLKDPSYAGRNRYLKNPRPPAV